MDHIAEITLLKNIALVRFDPQNKSEVKHLEELLGNLADEGVVYGLEFHTSQ
jgi:hypothetical protein